MQIFRVTVLTFVFLLAGCGIVNPERYGLHLNIINEIEVSWEIYNVTHERVVVEFLPAGSGTYLFIGGCRRYDDRCEVTLLARVISEAPPGCDGYEVVHKTFRYSRDDYNDYTWDLDDADPIGCDKDHKYG